MNGFRSNAGTIRRADCHSSGSTKTKGSSSWSISNVVGLVSGWESGRDSYVHGSKRHDEHRRHLVFFCVVGRSHALVCVRVWDVCSLVLVNAVSLITTLSWTFSTTRQPYGTLSEITHIENWKP